MIELATTALDQPVTIGGVLGVVGVVLAGIVVIGVIAFVISIFADAWKH